MQRLLLSVQIILLSGCFWESSPPDLNIDDTVVELVVIWDQKINEKEIHRIAWSSKEVRLLQHATEQLNTEHWRSLSTLPAAHASRIILTMRSGNIWEIVLDNDDSKSFKMFNRNDRGWPGYFSWSSAFLDILEKTIEKDIAMPIDLAADYRLSIMDGLLQKITSEKARLQIARFSGYPEMLWNKSNQTFEYAK